jgi:hypothetical protein
MSEKGTVIPNALIVRFWKRAVFLGPVIAIAGYLASSVSHIDVPRADANEIFIHDVVAAVLAFCGGLAMAAASILDGRDGMVSEGVVIELARSVRLGTCAGLAAGTLAGVVYAGRFVDIENVIVAIPLASALGGLVGWLCAAVVGRTVDSPVLEDPQLERLAESAAGTWSRAGRLVGLALALGGIVAAVAAFPLLASGRGKNDPVAFVLIVVIVVLASVAGNLVRRASTEKREAEKERERVVAALQENLARGKAPGTVSLATPEPSEGAVSLPQKKSAE